MMSWFKFQFAIKDSSGDPYLPVGNCLFAREGRLDGCTSCSNELTAYVSEDWQYRQLENTTHLLHGVVYTNGYGHFLRINGRQGGSKFLTGIKVGHQGGSKFLTDKHQKKDEDAAHVTMQLCLEIRPVWTSGSAAVGELKPLIVGIAQTRVLAIMLKWEGDAGKIMLDGKHFALKQIHWHSPAEHTISGSRFGVRISQNTENHTE